MAILAISLVEPLAHADDQLVTDSHSVGMIGKPVKSSEGKKLGTIMDLVINWRSEGYAEYVVLSLGGFWGLGEDHVAVPSATLTASKNKEYYVLDMEKEQLRGISGSTAYRFYDRSAVPIFRAGESIAASSVYGMKGHVEPMANVSLSK